MLIEEARRECPGMTLAPRRAGLLGARLRRRGAAVRSGGGRSVQILSIIIPWAGGVAAGRERVMMW